MRENKAKMAEYQRRYRQTAKGKAARAAGQKRYRERHPERIDALMTRWLEKNPTYQMDRGRRRYAEDPQRQQRANRQWKAKNIDRVREHGVRAMSARRARKYGNSDERLTRGEWDAIKAAYDGRCAYCFAETARPTQEHVIPLSKGGAHARANVVPACPSCNRSKGTKTLWDWLFPERLCRG